MAFISRVKRFLSGRAQTAIQTIRGAPQRVQQVANISANVIRSGVGTTPFGTAGGRPLVGGTLPVGGALSAVGRGISAVGRGAVNVGRSVIYGQGLKGYRNTAGLIAGGITAYNINRASRTGDPRDILPSREQLAFVATAPFNILSSLAGQISGGASNVGKTGLGFAESGINSVIDTLKGYKAPSVPSIPSFGTPQLGIGDTSLSYGAPTFGAPSIGGATFVEGSPQITVAGGGGGDFGITQALLLGIAGGGLGGYIFGRRRRKRKKYKRRKRKK